jgi:arogenate/prephenate dehydratase
MDALMIAFQGEAGAYSEQAALEYFGPNTPTLPCPTFEDAFVAVTNGQCSHGMLPIENSLAGSIHQNYDLMLLHKLHIVGEYHLRVRHNLLALPSVKLDEIRRVYSHPQALAQCQASLKRLGLEMKAASDTAGSARHLRETNDRHAAAVASQRAAQVYQLEVVLEKLEDNPANFTRFLALAKKPLSLEDPEIGDYKTSIVFHLLNKPGALFKAMSVFALRDIDLTKIESRPIQGKPWDYSFYIDFAGHAQARICNRALEHLAELATFLRIFGSYPRHRMEQ